MKTVQPADPGGGRPCHDTSGLHPLERDLYRHSGGDAVVHRGKLRPQLADLLEPFVGAVGLDPEIHPDALVGLGDVLAKAEEAVAKEEPKENPYANDPKHKNAARIARVMVADLLLYHKQEVEEGIRNGDFFERNKEALDDMRSTYDSRLDEEVRNQWDYLEPAIQKLLRDKREELGVE